MPTLPPVDACERFRDKYPSAVELQKRYDNRWGLGDRLGSNSTRALIGGWLRFDEPRVTDALAVAAYTDAFVPAVFAVLANCTAASSVYTSRAVCTGVCNTLPPGQEGDDGVSRLYDRHR